MESDRTKMEARVRDALERVFQLVAREVDPERMPRNNLGPVPDALRKAMLEIFRSKGGDREAANWFFAESEDAKNRLLERFVGPFRPTGGAS
jgi:hypothetical protein